MTKKSVPRPETRTNEPSGLCEDLEKIVRGLQGRPVVAGFSMGGVLACPVLIISGRKDREHPIAVIRKVANRSKPVATFEELAGHGHWLIGEPGWEKIAEWIEPWLRRTAGGSVGD